MPYIGNRLFLYEALELRGEIDARIKTLRDCLPETRSNRNRMDVFRQREGKPVPAEGFDPKEVAEQVKALELKRRKINTAIQRANFLERIYVAGENVSLAEALEIRKSLNERLGELHSLVVESAYARVIYKEDRDIVESPEVSFPECMEELDHARLRFRQLNRGLRQASFRATVDFYDEP